MFFVIHRIGGTCANKNFKAKEKGYKRSDSGGLYLLVNPNGGKYWRLKYRYGDKEKLAALGVYPEVTLKEARLKRDEYKKQLTEGDDPTLLKKTSKAGNKRKFRKYF